MAPKSRYDSKASPDELMLRSLQRIAEAVEAVRWLLIVICLLLLGVIAANFAALL